jgi:hypothetical protein
LQPSTLKCPPSPVTLVHIDIIINLMEGTESVETTENTVPVESTASSDNPATPGTTVKKKGMKPEAICFIVTVLAVIGGLLSLFSKNPLWIFIFLLPATVYEAIRTEEGATTKYSSIVMLIVLIAEIVLILFNVNYDLAQLFETTEKTVAGYTLPLGDIKVVGPLLMAVLSIVLIFRTYGRFTKYLAIVIAAGSLVAVLLINPTFFEQMLKQIVDALIARIG